MKIIEANDDALVFERAFIARDDHGNLVPHCLFSGITCQLGTKETALDLGFTACWPLDPRFQANWPMTVTLQDEGVGLPDVRANFTANPGAVAAARKFLLLLASDKATPGQPL